MLSIPHLVVIFVVALIIFGPEKLPELARNLGKVMAEFRRATGDLRSSFEGHMRDLEREAQERRIAAPAPDATPPRSSEPVIMPAPGTVPADRPNYSEITEPPPDPPAQYLAIPDPPAAEPGEAPAVAESTESQPVPLSENPEQVSTDGSARPA